VLSREYIEGFYDKHITDSGRTVSGDELRAPCPYHADKDPSFSVNLTSGVYKCFVQGCKLFDGGNIYQFLSIIDQITLSDASAIINEESGNTEQAAPEKKRVKETARFPYTQADIDTRVESVLSNKTMVEFIQREMMWTVDTIKKFEIGYDTDTQRYWIPIKQNNKILNIRRYSPTQSAKVISVTGFGTTRLFPADNLEGNEIFIMEGEKDTILANQLGLNAVTMTGGAGGTFRSEWKVHFSNKQAFICYDVDTAGREGAIKVANTLIHVTKSLKIINLPMKEPKNADFTDYIRSGKTIQDFIKLVDDTPALEESNEGPVKIPDEVHRTSLDQIDSKRLFYRRSRVDVRVIGTESSPFILPRTITINCNKDNGKNCATCRVGDKNGKDSMVLDESSPALLSMIETGTRDRTTVIKDLFHIPSCKKYTVEEEDHQAINRVSVIPAIDDIQYDEETQNQKFVERELYFIGDNLVANTDYEIEVLTVPSPKDQSMVHIGYKVKYADSSVEEFQLTPELKEQLEVFRCQ
jgi:hypothetical protein